MDINDSPYLTVVITGNMSDATTRHSAEGAKHLRERYLELLGESKHQLALTELQKKDGNQKWTEYGVQVNDAEGNLIGHLRGICED